MKDHLHIALVYDLRDDYLAQGLDLEAVAEFDSPATIEALGNAIQALGHRLELVGNGLRLASRLASGQRWDLVFNISEGLRGRSREAQVPAILEMYGIPYTFSDPLACALTLDKAMTKRVLLSAGLPTPGFLVANSLEDLEKLDLSLPLFAKPVAEGTGKGIDANSRIDRLEQLGPVCQRLWQRFKQPVLIEQYLPGREFTAAILGTDQAAYPIGTIEVKVRQEAPTRDYGLEVKEACERFVQYVPLPAGPLRSRIEDLALQTHRLLGCRDASRVDIRLDASGEPAILEVNPLPGLHPTHSDLPMIAQSAGICYNDLIDRIIQSAIQRQVRSWQAAGRAS